MTVTWLFPQTGPPVSDFCSSWHNIRQSSDSDLVLDNPKEKYDDTNYVTQ